MAHACSREEPTFARHGGEEDTLSNENVTSIECCDCTRRECGLRQCHERRTNDVNTYGELKRPHDGRCDVKEIRQSQIVRREDVEVETEPGSGLRFKVYE
jgi:hypothetical protein